MESIHGAYNYFFEEKPIVFFDTHPEPEPGIIYDSLNRLKKHLITAWTAVPDLDVAPGQIRLAWITVSPPHLALANVNFLLRQQN